jgi:hypothetical protein
MVDKINSDLVHDIHLLPKRPKPAYVLPTAAAFSESERSRQHRWSRATSTTTHVHGATASVGEVARVSPGSAGMPRSTIRGREDERGASGCGGGWRHTDVVLAAGRARQPHRLALPRGALPRRLREAQGQGGRAPGGEAVDLRAEDGRASRRASSERWRWTVRWRCLGERGVDARKNEGEKIQRKTKPDEIRPSMGSTYCRRGRVAQLLEALPALSLKRR